MTTIVRPPPDPITNAGPTVVPDDPKRGPMRRIVGGSLATGLVGALVLTLVIFAGAAEHVIAGSALLAFAFGWGMLAVLSTRLTSQPQRWAFVPAAFMAVVALALLVLTPDDRALNAVGWVWPPVVLALAVWMFIQLRRALTGRVRWLLYPVVAMLAVGAVGGMYETVALARDHHRYAAPGTLYDIGGHRLHLNCTGSGGPTVVLENGLAETSPFWSRITAEVGRTARVCAYDRAGQGWSDDAAGPQNGLAVAADLHTLLGRAHESGPYLLVGHSAGGSYAMIYAAQYPDEVAGMVLLDSTSPDQFTVLPDFAAEYSMTRRMVAVLPSLARLGLAQALPASDDASLPEPAASQARAFATSPRQMRNVRDEQSVYRDLFTQAQALSTLGNKPLVVVTTTESQHGTKGWSAAQDNLATLSSNRQHRIADATHVGLLTDEHSFEPSVQAIREVLQSIRTGEPVVDR
jgi:pimeloyl-ACP methyl ester carboxylesterase